MFVYRNRPFVFSISACSDKTDRATTLAGPLDVTNPSGPLLTRTRAQQAYDGAVSIAVAVDRLGETIAGYGFAYLLTIGDDARPHVTAVSPTWSDARVRVADPGRRTRANVAERPQVTVVWPPPTPDGYSLIVDGTGTLDGDLLLVAATRAVLHRPAPAPGAADSDEPPSEGACVADCVELTLPGS